MLSGRETRASMILTLASKVSPTPKWITFRSLGSVIASTRPSTMLLTNFAEG